MRTRWQLARAGLLNFWYYHDEAEFQLSGGRLILRGTNGSGKSVTMQSFLPLVLDGDKRPWRLDPFGSRDRKIEYYLLLDENSGITDRTGYLYLEFYHPEQDRFITVGIGLRARRNVPGTGFWGFVVTDNRRIGKDIFLYQKDYSQGQEAKIPLTKSQLAEVIGSGGELVTEQGEYRKLVNKHLFGFADIQAYQEMLDLLIQLRSPKLSKDFKPSTIYEILTDALPALQEDELRPLSEVLEDMDQISDRLEELAVHCKEAERLEKDYNSYNEYLLFTESRSLLEERRLCDEGEKKFRRMEEEVHRLSGEITAGEERLEGLKADLRDTKTEYETISQSEAVEREAELERLKDDEKNTRGEIEAARRRLAEWEKRRDKAARDREEFSRSLSENLREQHELVTEMEAAARDCDFHLHDMYHRQWQRGIEADDVAWDSWKRDAGQHEQKLQEALRLAREERDLNRRIREAEKDLSEAREQRDKAETDLRQAEQDWENARDVHQGLIFAWRKGLSELPLSDEAFQEILHLLTRYPEIAYEAVSVPARKDFERIYRELSRERADLEHLRQAHLDSKQELMRQLREWIDKKEPEPPRSEAREKSRARRLEAGDKGGSLYAVCEFREGLSEEIKAGIESALAQAGLLDAWVNEGGLEITGDDEEEVWIEPCPQLLAHTLADYLYATPPEDGSVSAEIIDGALRTILVGETGEGSGAAVAPEKGAFRLGPVEGRAPLKARAEYIGRESRRLTRLAEIARLEELIRGEQEAVSCCDLQLAGLNEKERQMREDLSSFPGGEDLYRAYSIAENRQRAFKNARDEEGRRHDRFRKVHEEWSGVRARFHSFMEGWSIPRSEQGISDALDILRSYRSLYSDLKARWINALAMQRYVADAAAGWEEASDNAVAEAEYLDEKEQRLRDICAQIGIYTELLREMGIYDLHQKMDELKEKAACLEKEIERVRSELSDSKVNLGIRRNEAESARQLWQEQESVFRNALESWLKEWKRRLVPEWQEETLDTDEAGEAVLSLARRVRQQYRTKYEQKTKENFTNRLYDQFYQIRQSLHEYSPELLTEPDTGRMLVVFARDRQNPVTPGRLLQELRDALEEQRLLLSEKDRELYEQIIIHSVGRAIRQKIFRAEEWVRQMNHLMQQRVTSSGMKLLLKWESRAARNEQELDTAQLVKLLKTDANLLRDEQIEQMVNHFRSRITWAKRESEEHKETLRYWITQLLDYRQWFRFTLDYEKGDQSRRELTDARFNVLSGGEKAMAMYIPLFAAVYSRYSDSRPDSPKIISLDEAFAGVDDENMRDMFELLTQLDFDYIMTSQVLWGCYDTVPELSVYELYRPGDAEFVTLIRYHWNGIRRTLVDDMAAEAASDAAATAEMPEEGEFSPGG